MSDSASHDASVAAQQLRAMEAEHDAFRKFLAKQPKPSVKRPTTADPSDEDEDALFYSGPYLGERFFRYINPRNPTRTRRRVERLYWESWSRFVMGLLLSSFGALLFVAGVGCCICGESLSRGGGVVMAGVLMCIPGFYSLYIQWGYLACKKGFSLDQLPD